MNASQRRQRLTAAGYVPIPLRGKVPPGRQWEQTADVTSEMISMWAKTWPDARNTGLLTRLMPTLDLDILNEEAVRALEDTVRERHEEHGLVLVRIGLSPKRAIPFRTDEPFSKIAVDMTAPNGSAEKIEFLADGQQVCAFGIHPQTNKKFAWFGGEPGEIKREALPCIREAEAQELVDALVEILVREFGYTRAKERPRKRAKGNGVARGDEDWQYLFDNIHRGRALHDTLRDLAAKMVKSGMNQGAAINQLRALMNASAAPHDKRWRERYNEIPRLVESAEGLVEPAEEEPKPAPLPQPIEKTLAVFDRWLILKDHTPVLAVLGTVAANYLDGDPVWLGLIGPPSSAKTELLNACSALPHVVQVATVTPAGLLSGVPKKQAAKGSKGGLLHQIGDFGMILLKDFGSVLSMHPETKQETLAALREVYDGHWTRVVGSDGGRSLAWAGKVGLIFAATEVIDAHHTVISTMGDRFLLSRLPPNSGKLQFERALDHVGAASKLMRKELADAVAALFAGRKLKPRPLSTAERKHIGNAICLAVRLRGAVDRDRRTRDLDMIYGEEGTARIGLALERLLAGLDTLGVEREAALSVVLSVALDSVPPLRRAAYECVKARGNVETADVAVELGLPTNSARRVLEDLAAHRLVVRRRAGKADQWDHNDWQGEDRAAEEAWKAHNSCKNAS